ncbi:MAG: hypothetical protein UU73_C0004G0076 [Candidatus Daviesbacteria bacterium GW2011_GWA1_41_61]|uniref:NOMO fifth transthyretin-like domain-containing protein n=1 Tax=Candidatus Daviesbacteria bacterium GW2011_GWA2_40_9 TaxID=1618424 RepID=A0A0G0X3D6_9BACT|nr:MAG: hypothetical protein UU26_C0022G0029 [Candidatus Daviesbacteria bacterium GW2011_GWC1_40_9]KKR82097.1 MAG: hypothetical protein UU29_C0018G0024 [Candidatus Daviesbacteria bacterium GW2011_GWA2_40_9]KKR93280.1 MAG: hypothetical protein UU44_C0003G0076 [Candidatus Daviesbacteria bacterium GW2011_GWB1_41_15]KKS14768.1 MAG: hypothetical protein UU73_C0004G0076 [Candidatus Daviesbacteria bacterium GW2011_GWA1_41_61]
MKIKLILSLFLLLLGGIVLSQQIKTVVAQQTENTNTSAITSPISYFAVSGQVTYKAFGKIIPAGNVWVRINRIESGSWYYVSTNSQGYYSALVRSGNYVISAIDSLGTQFKPSSRFVTVSDSNIDNISFQGRLQTKK